MVGDRNAPQAKFHHREERRTHPGLDVRDWYTTRNALLYPRMVRFT